jgi:hypothetical protein
MREGMLPHASAADRNRPSASWTSPYSMTAKLIYGHRQISPCPDAPVDGQRAS